MGELKDWIDAARPKTLGAAVAPVLVGTALGWKLRANNARGVAPSFAGCMAERCW